VENSLWKELLTYRKTDYMVNDTEWFPAIFGLGFDGFNTNTY
jgi:hypothetical protein